MHNFNAMMFPSINKYYTINKNVSISDSIFKFVKESEREHAHEFTNQIHKF